MTKIFISYRRQDTRHLAGRIFDRLEAKFGRDHVFMDIDSIPFGVDFHDFLSGRVGEAKTVLALIGHGWADALDEAGNRRLDNPDDFVRIEIEAALQRGIPLGAVLIDGAPMPRPEQLPETMRALTRRNAAFLDSGRDFNTHMNRLIADLEQHLNGGFAAASPVIAKPRQTGEDRYRAEGRIRVDAAIVTGAPDKWFLPGAGKTESFKDHEHGPEMVVVPAGQFMMGSPPDEEGRFDNEGPQHQVTISKPFAIGRHTVTRGEFAAFVKDTDYRIVGGAQVWTGSNWKFDPSKSWRDAGFPQDDSHPVVCVNWDDAQAYIAWLKAKIGQTYRLPSEVEWEYICRAGTVTPFWWGSSISTDQANYNGRAPFSGKIKGDYRAKTLPVKSFDPNPWGLYQVHGNVWEWCADHMRAFTAESLADPVGSLESPRRALRGGSWVSSARYLRAASRDAYDRVGRYFDIGFRCARVLE